jgi:hypothetical protein
VVRLTHFWERMTERFGPGYVDSVARDQVIRVLGDRTVYAALEAGVEPKEVWLAVCEHFDVPAADRH